MDHTLNDLKRYVERAAEQGVAAHEVEADLWRRVLRLGYQAMELWFEWAGTSDVGETATLPDDREVRRLDGLHRRASQSVFGYFEIERTVYGSREGQKLNMPLSTPSFSCPKVTFLICFRISAKALRWSRLIAVCLRPWGTSYPRGEAPGR